MESSDIGLSWALMPLSEDELSKVPKGHTIRPYLLLKEENGYYWAFPSTSKAFSKKSRYTNSSLIVNGFGYEKSLVMLDKVYKLPFDNMRGGFARISEFEENQLVKRLRACSKFANYPEEVTEFINNMEYEFSWHDLITHNNELYVIVGKVPGKDIFYSLKVLNHEFDGALLKVVDTNKYFVDCSQIHCIVPDSNTEYVSVMYGLSSGRFDKDKEELEKLIISLKDKDRVSSNLTEDDFRFLGRLPFGTVISYSQDDLNYKMVVLDRDDTNTYVIFGLENQIYRDFKVGVFPNDYIFSFNVVSTLTEERVERLVSTKLISNEDYLLQKK